VLAALHSDAGFILTWDAAEACFKLTAQRGLSPAEGARLADAPTEWFFDDEAPHTILDLAIDELPEALRMPGMQTLLATGSIWRGRMAGALGVYWKTTPVLNVEEIALFRALADQLAVLIENVRLRQAHDARVAEQERQRLARDLHDSVTQAVYSLALTTDTASNRLAKGQLERLEQSLALMRTQARQALRDLRLLLYELQLATPDKMTLEESLQLRLDAVERRAGVEAELHITPGLLLPRAWERELYWIAMEALNNALKHAQASRVSVHLEGNPDGALLTITDNGQGLPSSTGSMPASSAGIGLHSMAARAASIGGVFSIGTLPGGGTSVAVRIEEPPPAPEDGNISLPVTQTATTGQAPASVTVGLPERQRS
jgi:signal transduction histidine kinase